ncbi:prepilin peptidase [[Clostridium] polysaccharolyticum]|uniref:Leader peptidase (Prepilin peptidase) / N-methyltransferase n=1 Tax=[Clostridium] polysaccharolyticum TaxID=29364 RepID=A0A1H9Y8Q2_9FIRM|nr:prepilin peptidase [[Clostridium] polysaccharolyticum]SES65198.1 leader peptidase (prepilin peptidase) / N-methyltransferase [[Clostridium] polysaccharolyticum]
MKRLYIMVLIYAAYKDIKTLQVKNWVHVSIVILALMGRFHILEAFLITLPFLVLAVKTNSIGGGDIKFIFANTCLLGIEKMYEALLIGFGMLSFQYLIMKRNKKKMNKKVPLLPYLVTGLLYEIF